MSRNQLIQRLRDTCAQRRLFTGDRGAIAASLVEIGVAMLAVGILTAGAVTSFTGFIDSASDSTARGRLTDAAATSDQVYNWLRPGGERCYSDTACANTDTTAASALQEAAGGQLTFAAWPTGATPDFALAGTIYVQVAVVDTAYNFNNKGTGAAANNHNGIAGNPDAGHWVRLATKSDSGATFCVIKVAHTADPVFEGVGYMSVNSDASETTTTAAHCGGHNGQAAPDGEYVTSASCVYGSDGASTEMSRTLSDMLVRLDTTSPTTGVDDHCATDRALGRPGAGYTIYTGVRT